MKYDAKLMQKLSQEFSFIDCLLLSFIKCITYVDKLTTKEL